MTRSAAPPARELPAQPFSVVDELSCYHDHPAEPNNVHLEMRLSGRLDEGSFRAATAIALAAEPRARARRARCHPLSRGFRWEFPPLPDCDPVSLTSWTDESDLARKRATFLADSPPLDSAPPLRLLLAAGPAEDCVILNAHHAAFDGLSCLELLRGIARNYPRGAHEPVSRATATAISTADAIAGPDFGAAAGFSGPRSAARGGQAPATRRRALLPRAVTRIAADRNEGSSSSGYGYHLMPGTDVCVFQPFRSQFLATVNDLLVGALIVAVADWNAAHGQPASRIRITMPVSARLPGQAAALGNLSRLAVVTAPWPAPDRDIDALIGQVVTQTRFAKDTSGPEVDGLSRALTQAWLPAGVKRRLVRALLRTIGPAVIDTSLVTNLGSVPDPLQFGSVTATRMAFSTSAHMPRGLSVGAITVGDRLQICLRYRRALLDSAAAARFARCYSQALNELAQHARSRAG